MATAFFKLGVIGFGGPAAHVALMHREFVERRRWLPEQRFLDLFALSNLVPGPTSTELALFVGYERAGWPAMLVAGIVFILPAMAIVLGLAWAYVRFGSLPEAGWVLYGVSAAIIGIVADALWKMSRATLKGWWSATLATAVLVLYFLGVNVLILLFGGAILFMLIVNAQRLRSRGPKAGGVALLEPFLGRGLGLAAFAPAVSGPMAFSLATLFFTFLRIGAVLYGSGYVLLAFLQTDFVTHLHWLTDRQLVDAVSIGQVTPGPLFTTATFIGYVTGGLSGALVATVAIFLPSFVFAAAAYPLLPRLMRSAWAQAFLSGATASALGLMGAVTVQLGRAVIVDPFVAALAVVSFAVIRRWSVNSAWLVLGGGVAGFLAKLLVR